MKDIILLKEQGKKKYTIIVGCGRLGASLANTLSDKEEDVLVIDLSKDSFRKLSPSFGGLTISGDAADLDILLKCEINRADAVVVVTDNDNVNIMIAQLAKEMYRVPRVITRLYNPDYSCVYTEFNIDTIFPAILSAAAIEGILDKESRV